MSEKKTSKMNELLSPGSTVRRVATGFQFTEGPVWNGIEGYLLFSDIPGNQIKMWTPEHGISTFRESSGNSNGLTYDKEGRLIACEHGNRRVSRTEADGTVLTLVDRFHDKRLNSPNDVVVKSNGDIYFTDPPYGIESEEQELSFQGVYRYIPKEKRLELLVDDFDRPNGLAFSPDESRLYIGDSSSRCHIRIFEVDSAGSLSGGEVLARAGSQDGPPDGMKVDEEGRLYVTAEGGIWVFDPSGELVCIIKVPETPANLAWGRSEYSTMFITAQKSLYQVHLRVRGIPVL